MARQSGAMMSRPNHLPRSRWEFCAWVFDGWARWARLMLFIMLVAVALKWAGGPAMVTLISRIP